MFMHTRAFIGEFPYQIYRFINNHSNHTLYTLIATHPSMIQMRVVRKISEEIFLYIFKFSKIKTSLNCQRLTLESTASPSKLFLSKISIFKGHMCWKILLYNRLNKKLIILVNMTKIIIWRYAHAKKSIYYICINS